MPPSFRHIEVERRGDVFCVRLRRTELQEIDILEFADEVISLIIDQGCRKLVLHLGPGAIDCLYSVFLAKLVKIRRRLIECGGWLVLSGASPEVMSVFEA